MVQLGKYLFIPKSAVVMLMIGFHVSPLSIIKEKE